MSDNIPNSRLSVTRLISTEHVRYVYTQADAQAELERVQKRDQEAAARRKEQNSEAAIRRKEQDPEGYARRKTQLQEAKARRKELNRVENRNAYERRKRQRTEKHPDYLEDLLNRVSER